MKESVLIVRRWVFDLLARRISDEEERLIIASSHS
jgi:hypothetical protein